jgi:hypothetical protein
MTTKIGKFQIFASYKYVEAIADGMPDGEAKQYGYAIAVIGANGGRGASKGHHSKDKVIESASRRRKAGGSITPEMYENQIVSKLGDHYAPFIEAMQAFVEKGYSYEAVKEAVSIPKTRGAKIDIGDFLSVSP